jgi:hypothetical protein
VEGLSDSLWLGHPVRDDLVMHPPFSILIRNVFFKHYILENVFDEIFISVLNASKSVVDA